jgi:hypothetical protein
MALILIKTPIKNLYEAEARIAREGLQFVHDGLTVCMKPQRPHVIMPNIASGYIPVDFHRKRDHDDISELYSRGVVLFLDTQDRIPLANGAVITKISDYIDDCAFDRVMMDHYTRSGMSADVVNTLIIKLLFVNINQTPAAVRTGISRGLSIEFGDVPRGVVHCCCCHQAHDANGHYYHKTKTHPLICSEKCGDVHATTLVCAKSYAIPSSFVVWFLVEQMRIHFSVDRLVFSDEIQLVYLFGNDYYASVLPLPPRMKAEHYAHRTRLRMTPCVVAELTYYRDFIAIPPEQLKRGFEPHKQLREMLRECPRDVVRAADQESKKYSAAREAQSAEERERRFEEYEKEDARDAEETEKKCA